MSWIFHSVWCVWMFIGSSYFYSVDYQDEAETVLPNKEISGEGITFLKSYEFFFESLIIEPTEMMCTQKGDASTIIVTQLL